MPNNFTLPQINPVKFYHQADVLNTGAYTQTAYNSFNPNINERGIDSDFFSRNLKSWMDNSSYLQPYQQGDKLTLQWLGVANYAGPTVVNYVVRIIDGDGVIVKQQDATVGAEVPATSGIYIRECIMQLYDIPEGIYCVQIHKVGLFTDKDFFLISEPIEVKQHHPNTMLFKYSHTENAYGIFWETDIVFQKRMHSAFTELQASSKFNVYEDQPLNLTLLSGVKYRELQLSFGVDNNPMPEYQLDNIEEVLLCDTLYIDNVLYTRAEGSKMEIGRVDKNPLCTGNITVRPKENDVDLIVSQYPAILVMAEDTNDWFFVESLVQTTPATTYIIRKAFNGMQNFCDYLNTSNIIGTESLQGTYFALDNANNIVLITNDSTKYALFSPGLITGTILSAHLLLELNTHNGFDLVINYVNGTTAKYAFIYGDGSAVAQGTGTAVTVTKTYATKGTFLAKLFFANATEIYFNGTDCSIQTIEGKLTTTCEKFYLFANDLRFVKNNLFSNCDGSLVEVLLYGNILNKHAQNDVIRFAYNELDKLDPACVIDMTAQTPSASPSTDVGIYTTALLTQGITILTD